MVQAVPTRPTIGGKGILRGHVYLPYGLHTGKRAGATPRPHRAPYRPHTVLPVPAPYRFARTGPIPFCPYRPRTVLPVPAPNRFARTGPVPFCPYRPHTVLPVPFCPRVVLPSPCCCSCRVCFCFVWMRSYPNKSFQKSKSGMALTDVLCLFYEILNPIRIYIYI